jgi:hypothetical protein
LTSAAAVVKRTRFRWRHAAIARPVAGFTDQKHWLGALEIAAFGQGADARCRDVRRLREIKLFQRLHPRQVCILKAQFDGAPFTILDLALEQSFQVVKMRVVLLARFLSQRRELPSDEG